MQVGNYIFNPRYIEYVRLIKNEDNNIIKVRITDSGEIDFSFKELKEAEKVFKFIKRKMTGES